MTRARKWTLAGALGIAALGPASFALGQTPATTAEYHPTAESKSVISEAAYRPYRGYYGRTYYGGAYYGPRGPYRTYYGTNYGYSPYANYYSRPQWYGGNPYYSYGRSYGYPYAYGVRYPGWSYGVARPYYSYRYGW